MAKVYVSSTLLDLKAERRAVMDWLVNAKHQPVHSYTADSETVRASCVADVRDCQAYVSILGHRYGHVPVDDNPQGLSITALEYEAAVTARLPVVVLAASAISNVALTDVGNAVVYAKVLALHAKVNAAHRACQFGDAAALIEGLSTALPNALRNDPLDDPRVLAVIAKLATQKSAVEDEAAALRDENGTLKMQLAAAIARTQANADAPGASHQQIAAAQALTAGDTRPAEALLRQEETRAALRAEGELDPAAQTAGRKEAAALACERGAMAFQHDVQAALAAYHEATVHEPDEWSNWGFLGDLQMAAGDLAAAAKSYAMAQRLAQRRIDLDATDLQAARNLSVCHERIGEVLVAQGDQCSASLAYQASLRIRATLAARDPANTEWQRDLSISHNKIGDMLVAQGDQAAALLAHKASLRIRETLATRDPANTRWQRDLSVSHNKIGDTLADQGDQAAALLAYQASMQIAQSLAARDPANTEWQRDLSVSHDRIGDTLVAQGDQAAALLAYQADMRIAQTLAARDPANTQWQRDLSVSHNKIGGVLVTQGDQAAALLSYQASLHIHEALAARDPANVQWQLDVVVSCANLGDLEVLPMDARRGYLRRGQTVLEALAAAKRLPPNQDWRPWFEDQLRQLGSNN
jgi:predicted negative regulator of RcsB-dependent stress response